MKEREYIFVLMFETFLSYFFKFLTLFHTAWLAKGTRPDAA